MSRSAYHRGIEFVQALPLLLTGIHDIDFFVLERSLRPDVVHNGFRCVAEAAWRSREEGDAASEQTGRGAKHVGDLLTTHTLNNDCYEGAVQTTRIGWMRRDSKDAKASRSRIKLRAWTL
jgi:hypothetical protein